MKKLLSIGAMIVTSATSGVVTIDRASITMVEPAEVKVNEQLIKSANEGEASAQYTLGMYYYDHGKGMKTNLVETAKWFRKAAEQEHAEALFMYGECMDAAGNWTEAAKWYLKAAKQGNLSIAGQEKLAKMYAEGRGVEKNWIEAVKWYCKAVEGVEKKYKELKLGRKAILPWSLREPARAIGDMYAEGGWGVEKDESEAIKWYHKAAEDGNSDAMLTLGEMYFYGRGINKDTTEAIKWYHKAAERHNEKAYYRLANCYMHGCGVYKDLFEAVKWWSKWFQTCHQDLFLIMTLGVGGMAVLLMVWLILIVVKSIVA